MLTPSPTIPPSQTPAFDVRHLVTRTPAPRAQCPAEKPRLVAAFPTPIFTEESVSEFYNNVFTFLNAGGTPKSVINWYSQWRPRDVAYYIQEKDVTGDGVLDLVVTQPDSAVAFVCKNGQYERKQLINGTYHHNQPVIFYILDMNLDGVSEIIFGAGDARISSVSVFEWGGSEFQLLNYEPNSRDQPCADLLGSSSVDAKDTNGDHLLELVLKQAIPIWTEYAMGLPWRRETRTCSWNGKSFVLIHKELAAPEYRFQAVQDGDRATAAGNYDPALGLYQQAIFDASLQPWSQDRVIYEIARAGPRDVGVTPVPSPTPIPDPAEYPNLAAYARYRILLLDTVRGYLPEAGIVYSTLQEKYPDGQIGHAYAEMATAFWKTYQKEKNLGQACAKAIAYATAHPADVLSYLGNGDYGKTYYGYQSLVYTPEDICPFK